MARGLRLFSLTPMALLMVSASTISNTVSLTQLSPSVSSPVVLTPMAATAQATSATLLPLVSLLSSPESLPPAQTALRPLQPATPLPTSPLKPLAPPAPLPTAQLALMSPPLPPAKTRLSPMLAPPTRLATTLTPMELRQLASSQLRPMENQPTTATPQLVAMAQPQQLAQAPLQPMAPQAATIQPILTAMASVAPAPMAQLFRLAEMAPLPGPKKPPTYPVIARSLTPMPLPLITTQQQTTARQTLSRIQSFNALPELPTPATPLAMYLPQLATTTAQATAEAATQLGQQTTPAAETGITLPPSNLADLEELLLEFQLDDTTTPSLITAYLGQSGAQAGTLYLPLGAISKALGLPIQVNAAQGTAKGWVVSPNRTVALNDLNSTITVQGQTTPLPAGSTLRTPTDILVSTQQLQQWLPANFALTLDTMVLSAYSTEILPETARLARQRIWDNLRERTPEQQLGQLHTLKRSWLGWPSLKADYGTTYGQSEGKTIASNNLNLQAQGPMAGMDGLLSLNFQQGTNNQRTFGGGSFRLEKTATASETLLGPLQARQYELGDVNLPRIALMPTAGQGRGVALTNKTPGFAGSLNEFELQGPGPQGWDVEVYQNDNLLTFGQVGIDGRYRFTNLNLRPGQNSFRVVLYGPQGEKQESTQNFTLGENLVKPGEWIYEAGVLESQNSVIATGQSRQAGVPTLVLNSFYGLNRNLTLNVGVAQGPMGAANQTTTGANLGLRAAYGRSFTQLDATMLAEGDLAASLREKVRLGKDTDVGAFLTRFASSTLVAGQATGNYGADFTSNFQLGANLGVQFAPYAAVEPAAGPSPQPAQLGSGPNYKLVPARGEGFGYAVADVVTFIDENTNGTRDANEETVAGVEVRNLRSGITATTNAAGSARITALLPNSNNTLEVIESTLPSLTLKPASVYHTLIAQGAGYSGQVAIALVYQAEVTGQLSLKPNQSAGGLQITLTNTKGEKLETTTPDAEGNFSFQPVPTGSYQVTVQNAQGQTTQTPLTITKTNLNPVLELPVP